jgi:lipopolysaccharide transport system ATP-binding protein
MTNQLISCSGIKKKFCRDFRRSLWYGLTDTLGSLCVTQESLLTTIESKKKHNNTLRKGEFWANDEINFTLNRGECLGLLGKNGAGKTTLLKMLNGLIKPDAGTIKMRGKLSAMIALGAGFNPLLTGRENILVNGSILGLSKREILSRMEEIIDFSEIGDSIDSPVKNYSSGMQVRLGFASAVHLIKPDILLLDEVLAVGDIGFTIKCLNHMRKLTADCAVIFVTHSIQFVSLFCTHAMLMENGRQVLLSDNIAKVIDTYHSTFTLEQSIAGTGDASISNIRIITENAEFEDEGYVNHSENVHISFNLSSNEKCRIHIQINSQNLIPIVAAELRDTKNQPIVLSPGDHQVVINLGKIDFTAGLYPIIFGVSNPDTGQVLLRLDSKASLRVEKEGAEWGFLSRTFETHAKELIR